VIRDDDHPLQRQLALPHSLSRKTLAISWAADPIASVRHAVRSDVEARYDRNILLEAQLMAAIPKMSGSESVSSSTNSVAHYAEQLPVFRRMEGPIEGQSEPFSIVRMDLVDSK